MKKYRLFSLILLYLTLFSTLFANELKPDFTIMIPMRDGTELPTDLYLPSPEAKGLPCILLRSPSGRIGPWSRFAELAKAGYLIAIQDTRSVLDREGKTLPFLSDGWGKQKDGYDTVEWLAASPYTNGRIGTWGASALGITQLLMAPTEPPHLECQYILMAASSLYHQGLFPGGQLLKHQAESWLRYYAPDTGIISFVSQNPFYNNFWKQFNTIDEAGKVKIPGMHIGGWYDTFLQGTLSAFTSRQYEGGEGARNRQKMVIGPWTHFWPLSNHLGDFEVPANGNQLPDDISPKRWFDHYLKDIENGIENIPSVIYYVMGPFDGSPSKGNIWKSSDVWPVSAKREALYLSANHALEKMTPKDGQLSYNYDPKNPIPTIGGRNLFLESGPKDQHSIEGRDDILIFTTDQLKVDTEVTGPITAYIYFTTDQKDTDLVLRLTDVYPDGRSVLISEGSYRLGVMQGYDREVSQENVIEAHIDLWATSMVFAKGHSIRLSVSSSNFPRCEKNHNVGLLGCNSGSMKVAKNVILMGKKYPSRIILPIVD
jgi:uncharacterized protein